MPGLDVDVPDPVPAAPAPGPAGGRILWPSLDRAGRGQARSWVSGDEPRFPDAMVIRERRRRDDAETHAPTFKACVTAAVSRVLIADPYLLCPGRRAEDEVLSWFPASLGASDVRIMCGGLRAGSDLARLQTRLADAQAAANLYKRGTGARASQFELRLTLDPHAFPYLHDRFAVVDDELWHFGSTVGGLHGTVNAASRGWDAVGTGAVRFFDAYVWLQPRRLGARSICDGGAR